MIQKPKGTYDVFGEKGKTIFRQHTGIEGMLYLDNKVTTKFTNITFIDGYVEGGYIYVPVISIRYEDSVSYFDGCEFYNNTGSAYGIIYIAYGGTGYFDNCIFGDNSAWTLILQVQSLFYRRTCM